MLKLYNTLTRKKETFKPLRKKEVGLYTCGPTVYDYAHVGNLRTYVFEDILRRVLKYNGFQVKHVMNITDVGHLTSDADEGEDKMEKGAKREKKTVWEIAEFYTKAFKQNMQDLNLQEPSVWCKATDYIKEQINLVKALEEKGVTYKTSDGVYFDTSKFKDYGKMAKLDIKGLREGARIEKNKEKKNITDFALWKFSPNVIAPSTSSGPKRQMEWDSPWGKGFPGWHVECSAMSIKHLGEQFDIHCGGIDLIPVHHTNEIAQSEAATGKKPWVKYWLHGDFLQLKKSKMAKSAGGFITLDTLKEKGFNPLAYRYLLLTAHYRSKLEFSWTNLEAAQEGLSNLYNLLREVNDLTSRRVDELNDYKKIFLAAINDDLDMPKAMTILWKLLKDKNIAHQDKLKTAFEFDKVLGLSLKENSKVSIPQKVKRLVKEREDARKNKDFKKADKLRNRIAKEGFHVEDEKDKTKIIPA